MTEHRELHVNKERYQPQPAMTKEEWEVYCDEKGHTPTWPPHDGYFHRRATEMALKMGLQ